MLALRHQVGQLFLVGLEGTKLSATEQAWLRLMRPGGFILFRRNIEAASETTTLLRDAEKHARGDREHIPAMRALDLEGGLVDRLRDLIGPTPSPAAVAATGRRADALRHGVMIGKAARLLGFNTTFAPVLDLALPASEAVMRTRVAGPTAEDVIAYATAFLAGLQQQGVLGCGKHFPGLGGGTLDSHTATPRIARTYAQLWDEDLAPYRELVRKLPIIMVAHAIYPKVKEARSEPASLSHFWITETLRRTMGFRGLVLSDDMEMGGLLTHTGIGEAAVLALTAGTDLLEICKEPSLILEAYEAVLSEAENSSAFRTIIRKACTRVTAQKRQLLRPVLPRNAAESQLGRLQNDLARFRSAVEHGGDA